MTFRIENLPIGRHELDTCIFSALLTILQSAGEDDLTSLSTAWDFMFPVAGVRSEEYFVSVPDGSSLVERLMPFSGWRSHWKSSASSGEAWESLKEELQQGDPVALAVDNYYLPFRPAYGDVHSKHLVLIYGYNEAEGTVDVLDATPPRFKGKIKIKELQRSRGSENKKEGERDHFFASNVIGFDMLSIERPADSAPRSAVNLYPEMLERAEFEMLKRPSSEEWLCGISGIKELAQRVQDTQQELTNDIFILTGTILAQRARLAEYFTAVQQLTGLTQMAKVVALCEDISYQWATLRILCSREAQERPEGLGPRISNQLQQIASQEELLLSVCREAFAQGENEGTF